MTTYGHEGGYAFNADQRGGHRESDTRRLSNRGTVHDDSHMPFGKYKGQRLGDVPDHYWRWFLGQDWCDEYPDLVEYASLICEE